MPLSATDWVVIVGYLLVNLAIGLFYRRRAGGNTEEFFVSGRDVSWWLAGTSMVATTPQTNRGVSAAKVVATIEVPASHQDTSLPETKNSSVLPPARRR